MNQRTRILIALSMAISQTAVAQRSDFSGVWTRVDSVPDRPSVAAAGDVGFAKGTMGSGWGSPVTIRQDSSRIAIEYPFFSAYDLQPPIRLVYALDGSESRNTVMIGHAASEQRSRATWQGSTLVITTIYPTPDLGGGRTSVDVRQALTLESPDRLMVETTRTGVPGAPASATRTLFTKGSPR